MLLQNILFPNEKICTEKDLYFRSKSCQITDNVSRELTDLIGNDVSDSFLRVIFSGGSGNSGSLDCKKTNVSISDVYDTCSGETCGGIIFKAKNQTLTLDTYFNSFSVFKWKKYTNISNLSVSLDMVGHFKVEIKNAVRSVNNNVVTTVLSEDICSADRQETIIDIPLEGIDTGLIYVQMTSLSDAGVFFGGKYTTDVGDDTGLIKPVKIAIAMCTFRREEYVEKNIDELTRFLIDNDDSPLHGNLDIYIADNSQSLDPAKFENDSIHIFPNKNLGGAGGFGRAMYEILKCKEEKGFTNIIMMDDDVKFDPNVFERLFAFLSMQKSEYKDAHIGGAMLELDRMWMQSEAGEYWYPKGHRAVKYMYDLRDIKWILKNEIEDSINNFGWWFCCMPISVVREDNLPLPIFIKRDDIEYGVRNGKIFITLNGVSVWHEAFEAKKTPFLDYYYYRNPMILNAGHCKDFGIMDMLDYFDDIKKIIDNDVNLYRYKEAHVKLQGIDDFLKGIDWLKQQDATALNNTIMNRWTYHEENIDELNCIFVHGVLEKAFNYKESDGDRNFRLRTNHGWDAPPKKGTVFAPVKNPDPDMICGAAKVVYCDEITQRGYVAYRSKTQREAVYRHFEMTRKNLIDNYERVREEYSERYNELTEISFWESYLFEEEGKDERPLEWWEEISDISDHRIVTSKENLAQYKLEIEEQKKLIDKYPIVSNRVVIYLYKRRGFTCNVKYILKELIKESGDKLDIIWVSDYPETCDAVRDMGIPVIRAGTREHWNYYFTARVNITSDCQPPYFLKRDDQIAITAWHGGISYKSIGFVCLGSSTDEELEIYSMKNRQPDYWLSGSQRFTDDTSFGFKHDKDVFEPTGMARNDIFFSSNTRLVKAVKKSLNIPENVKVAMYAPTFRRGGKDAGTAFDMTGFKKVLSDRFGGEWIVLYRGHYFIKDNPQLDALDVSQYEDVQELLCITDVLVSDYSSILWDYTFTGRPSFVYATDFDNFTTNDRGFFVPVNEWPYPIARNEEELFENISEFDEKDYGEKIALHHKQEGSFEKGSSAKAACKLIKAACGI